MPLGNRTGPGGLGPRTGRGLGYCSGYSYPGYLNPAGRGWGRGYGRGYGRGWGRGRGWSGWWDYPPYTPDYPPNYPYSFYPPEPSTPREEKEMLNEDLKDLKEEMKAIEERIKELETPKESKLPAGRAKKSKK